MGMYDNVRFEFTCPKCGRMLDGFQSKDGDCVFDTLKPEDVWSWHRLCPCGEWIEFEWEKDFAKGPKRVDRDFGERTDKPEGKA